MLHRGAHRHQQTISRVEARAATSRFFQVNLVPSLPQSESYLRIVLGTMPQSEQEAAVAALRIRRSRRDDLAKQFVFVLTEAAPRWRMGSAELISYEDLIRPDKPERVAESGDFAPPSRSKRLADCGDDSEADRVCTVLMRRFTELGDESKLFC